MKEEELREATGLSQLTEATGLSQVMEATAEEAMSRAAAPLQDPEEMAVEAMAVGVEAMAVEVDHWCKLMGGGNGGGGNDGGGGGNGGAVQATGLSQVMEPTGLCPQATGLSPPTWMMMCYQYHHRRLHRRSQPQVWSTG